MCVLGFAEKWYGNNKEGENADDTTFNYLKINNTIKGKDDLAIGLFFDEK